MRLSLALLLAIGLLGCPASDTPPDDTGTAPDVCTPTTETCNERDDDCDGAVDEDCPCSAGESRACGPMDALPPCMAGTQACEGGVWGACSGAVSPAPEQCGDTGTGDGVDQDCDGSVDDGCSCASSPELCADNLDNDCDGTRDETDCTPLPPFPGTAAPLGDPTAAIFNGLRTIRDPSARVPHNSSVSHPGIVPGALAGESIPYIPDIHQIAHRDTLILYLPNVAGAADYRAYAVGPDVTFTSTSTGLQPRGALISCAGYRQHTYRSAVVDGRHTREVLQAVELPGFVASGTYTVVVEAIASPCPYVGMPAHTDARITMANDDTTNEFHLRDAATYRYTGIPVAVLRSSASIEAAFGNVILNGQGASIDWTTRDTAPRIGEPVSPDDPEILADPRVVARSVIEIRLPLPGDAELAPVFDVGTHGIEENFAVDRVAAPSAIGPSPDYDDYNHFSLNPLFDFGDDWAFWGRFMQPADSDGGIWSAGSLLGVQAFTEHGRLYTTFGDGGQDVGGTLAFASHRAPIVELDGERYVHSIFRINSEASHRRYWWWALCGGATGDELYDAAAGAYRVRPLVFETTFGPGGNNPSVPDGHTLEMDSTLDAVGIARECLTITEEARPEDPFSTGGSPQTSAVLRAQIHPADRSHGIIALGDEATDERVLNGQSSLGFRFRVDASGARVGPVIDPFDQLAPLVHYDVFVRPNRLVVFVNGRQGLCVDLTGHPLTMSAAMIAYGDLLYHSSVEWQELSDSAANADAQLYQYQLNTPIASSRIWDLVGHADHIEIPSRFPFDASLCRPPADLSIQ